MAAPTNRPGQRSGLANQGLLSVGTSNTVIVVPANSRRISLTITNTGSATVYVGYKPGVPVAQAFTLGQNDSLYEEQFTGPIYLWVASGSASIPYVEVYF